MEEVKQKKITIKHYLNTNIKPVEADNGEKQYPVYVQIFYNRNVFRFRSRLFQDRLYVLEYKDNSDPFEMETLKFDHKWAETEKEILEFTIRSLEERNPTFNAKQIREEYDYLTRDISKDVSQKVEESTDLTDRVMFKLLEAALFSLAEPTKTLFFDPEGGLINRFRWRTTPEIKEQFCSILEKLFRSEVKDGLLEKFEDLITKRRAG